MPDSRIELTILLPCLNEARTLASCIGKAQSFLQTHHVAGEVIVCDNGSTDGSVAIARACGARVISVPQRGYGAALLAGIRSAEGRYAIMGDADDSYDFASLQPFLAALRQGSDLVVGNRFLGGIDAGAMPLLHRYLGNPLLSWLGRRFFRVRIGDFHCGLRGFSVAAARRLGLVCTGMEFATELIAKAALAGLRINEVPTTLQRDGRDRPPHLRTWRDGWRHLVFMLLMTPRWLFLAPGAVLTALGATGLVILGKGPLTLGRLGLDVHSLLYCSGGLILGLQLLQFAVLVKWMGVASGMAAEPDWLRSLRRHARLEVALLAGLGLLAGGLVWSAALVESWSAQGYAQLDPQAVMRSAIPAVTMMVVGLQACAGGFLASALGLALRSQRAAEPTG